MPSLVFPVAGREPHATLHAPGRSRSSLARLLRSIGSRGGADPYEHFDLLESKYFGIWIPSRHIAGVYDAARFVDDPGGIKVVVISDDGHAISRL